MGWKVGSGKKIFLLSDFGGLVRYMDVAWGYDILIIQIFIL